MKIKIEKLITKRPLLRWWLFAIIMVLATFGAFHTGIIDEVYEVDVTGLSFLILGIFGIFAIVAGIFTINDDQGFNLIMGIVVLLVMVIIHQQHAMCIYFMKYKTMI